MPSPDYEEEPIERMPPVSDQMLRVMEEMFPFKPPAQLGTEREDLYHAGAHSVVQFLRRAHEDQMERAREQMLKK